VPPRGRLLGLVLPGSRHVVVTGPERHRGGRRDHRPRTDHRQHRPTGHAPPVSDPPMAGDDRTPGLEGADPGTQDGNTSPASTGSRPRAAGSI
jgi:hypothetical protein